MEYDIWYTSNDPKILEFIVRMKAYNEKLGKNALMTPHLQLRGCGQWCSEQELTQDCLRGPAQHQPSYFCLPIGAKGGKNALHNGVKELCIYRAYQDEENAAKWWEYMLGLNLCRLETAAASCTEKLLASLQIPEARIRDCEANETNILAEEHQLMLDSEIPYNPALVINRRVYRVRIISYGP